MHLHTDQIRPDWEAKLAAVRAAVTRRANRRIIMRQVGDRLIPVGVTSGRVHALTPEEAAQGEVQDNGGSRRSRRRQQNTANQGLEQYIGMGGQDLEEVRLLCYPTFLSIESWLVAHGDGSDEVVLVGARRTAAQGSRREEEEDQ